VEPASEKGGWGQGWGRGGAGIDLHAKDFRGVQDCKEASVIAVSFMQSAAYG
jgi:hypothetical protein